MYEKKKAVLISDISMGSGYQPVQNFCFVVVAVAWVYRRHIIFPPLGNKFSLRTISSLFNLEFSSCNSWIYDNAFVRISDLFCCCCSDCRLPDALSPPRVVDAQTECFLDPLLDANCVPVNPPERGMALPRARNLAFMFVR